MGIFRGSYELDVFLGYRPVDDTKVTRTAERSTTLSGADVVADRRGYISIIKLLIFGIRVRLLLRPVRFCFVFGAPPTVRRRKANTPQFGAEPPLSLYFLHYISAR